MMIWIEYDDDGFFPTASKAYLYFQIYSDIWASTSNSESLSSTKIKTYKLN